MTLKRKAEDALADYYLPSKRHSIQQSPEHAYAAPAVRDAVTPRTTSPMEADLAPLGTAEQQEDQSEQHEVPPSNCTDLVVYRPPVMLKPSITAAKPASAPPLPPIVLCNGQIVDLQQPNGMALVLRSLTAEQRAGLRGMWDHLRDQKMLQNMLRKLPSPDQHHHGDDTIGAYRGTRAAGDERQPAVPCIIEELRPEPDGSNDDSDAVQTALPAAVMLPPPTVAAAGPAWELNGLQQGSGVGPDMQHPAIPANSGFVSGTSGMHLPQSPASAAALPQWQQIGQPALQPQLQQSLQQQQQQQEQQQLQQHGTLWPIGSNDAMMLDAAVAGQQQQQLQGHSNDDRAPMDMDLS